MKYEIIFSMLQTVHRDIVGPLYSVCNYSDTNLTLTGCLVRWNESKLLAEITADEAFVNTYMTRFEVLTLWRDR